MSWDEAKFHRFVDATLRMARGELPGYGYPHVTITPPEREALTKIFTCVFEAPGADTVEKLEKAAQEVLPTHLARVRGKPMPICMAGNFRALQSSRPW